MLSWSWSSLAFIALHLMSAPGRAYRAAAGRGSGKPAPAQCRARRAPSRMPHSWRCSKAATARRGSRPTRRSRFRIHRACPALLGARAAIDMREFAQAESFLTRPDAQRRQPCRPAPHARSRYGARAGAARRRACEARGAEARGGPAYGGAAPRGARADRRATLCRHPAPRRPAGQAQGLRCRAGRCAARHRARARRWRAIAVRRRRTARVLEPALRHRPRQSQGRARRRAELSRPRRRPRGRRDHRAQPRTPTGIPSLSCSTRSAASADATRQLETAERWLPAHDHDATLLYALGPLCERESLWGKAETYYEASLALDDHWRTHVALGELLGRLGRRAEPTRIRASPKHSKRSADRSVEPAHPRDDRPQPAPGPRASLDPLARKDDDLVIVDEHRRPERRLDASAGTRDVRPCHLLAGRSRTRPRDA